MKTLTAKNLIDIGIFTAIYFVILTIGAMIQLVAPLTLVIGALLISTAFSSVAGGIVITLFQARMPKFGALTIMGTLIGIIMAFSGHYWATPILSFSFGLVGDLIMKFGGYRKVMNILAYAIFGLWFIGPFLPIVLNQAAYIVAMKAKHRVRFSQAFADFFSPTNMLIFTGYIFICGLVGGWFGQRLLTRHFRRAGLAN